MEWAGVVRWMGECGGGGVVRWVGECGVGRCSEVGGVWSGQV